MNSNCSVCTAMSPYYNLEERKTDLLITMIEEMNVEELDELDLLIKNRKKFIKDDEENQIVIKYIRELFTHKNACAWNHGYTHSINPMRQDIIDVLMKKNYSHNVKSEPAQYIDCGVRVTYFPLFVGIYAPDHDMTKWEIDELEKCQNDWVDYMECNYDPNDEDQQYLVNLDWDYECIAYKLDDTFGTSTMFMEVYYKVSEAPKEGSKFKCFDCDGDIMKWEVRDGILYVEDKKEKKCDVFFGPVSDWDKYNLFVVAEDDAIVDDSDM